MKKERNKKSFHDLENAIKDHMLQALKSNVVKEQDLGILGYVFGKAETVEELYALLRVFSESFPFLQDLLSDEKGEQKADLEELLQGFVSEYVKKNPVKAAEIGKELANPDLTLEDLQKKHPEIREYLKNKS